MIMLDSSVVAHTVSTAGSRAGVAHRGGVPFTVASSPVPVPVPVPASKPTSESESEPAELTTVFDIMGRIFGAV